jgi:hypothetical protein
MDGLKKRFPRKDFPDRLGQDGGGGLLDQEPGDPQLGHLRDEGVVPVRGEDQDPGCGQLFENLPARFNAVEPRHRNVHHDHRGKQLPGQTHGFAAGLRLPDHLDVARQFEQLTKSLADDRVVIREQHGDRLHPLFSAAPAGNGSAA